MALGDILDVRGGNSTSDCGSGNAGQDLVRGNVEQDDCTLYGGAHQGIGSHFDGWNDRSPGAGTGQDLRLQSRARAAKLDLRDIDERTSCRRQPASASFIGSQALHKRAGELRTSGSLTQGDVDGNGTADFEIQVNVALIKSDFFL